jgi:thiol-disulfide isomerase/thioredoxin
MRLPVSRFAATSLLIAGLLYAAGSLGANPATAQTLSAAQRAEVEAMRAGEMRKLIVHDAPVPVSGEPMRSRDGVETTLAASNGRVRLVNFWATWCAPCREEFPALDALQRARGGADFEVIPIATGRNEAAGIDRFLAEAKITTLSTWLDPKTRLARDMDVAGLPVTVILNREGAEIARLMGGADWNGDSARAILDYIAALPG